MFGYVAVGFLGFALGLAVLLNERPAWVAVLCWLLACVSSSIFTLGVLHLMLAGKL